MEFKVIFYIIVGIGYFIYTNYKKLSEENKKRTFSPSQMPTSIPSVQEIKKVVRQEIQKAKPIFQSRKVNPPTQRVQQPVREKPKTRNTSFDILTLGNTKAQSQIFSDSILNDGKNKAEKNSIKNIFDLKTMRNAVIMGEIINIPAWTKY